MSKLSDNMDKRDETNISEQEKQPTQPTQITAMQHLKSLSMTSVDYKRIADQEYYIPEFLPKGGLFMLVSDSGNGKSWLSFMLSKRVLAQDKDAIIYFIDIDSGAAYTKSRVQNLHRDFGEDRFSYISQVKTDSQVVLGILKALAKEDLKDRIIVLDSLIGITEGKINQSSDVKPILNILEGLRNAGATVIIIHHVKKALDDEGKPVYAGSFAIKGAMDAVYGLVKSDKIIECHLMKDRGIYVSRTFKITDFHGMLADDIQYKSPEEVKAIKVKTAVAMQDRKIATILLLARDNNTELTKTQLTEKIQEELSLKQKYARSAIRRNVNNGVLLEVAGEKKTINIRLAKYEYPEHKEEAEQKKQEKLDLGN